jgi:8-oxo-dGTP pyrophosphatase MutT (NUDIX family)
MILRDVAARRIPAMSTHAGGVAIRERDGVREVVVVTSSSGVGWVLPKGLIDPGETAEEAALREVGEEAAVACETIALLGEFAIEKHGGDIAQTTFFLMRVLRIDDMREARERRWVTLEVARAMLAAPGAKLVLDAGTRAYLRR